MARNFNGSTDRINPGIIDLGFVLGVGGVAYGTMSVWVKFNATGGLQQAAIQQNPSGSPQVLFGILLNGTTIQGQNNGGSVSSSVTPTVGVWYNIVFQIANDGPANGFISVNGTVDVGAGGHYITLTPGAYATGIGFSPANAGRDFNGVLADVAFWNTDLTTREALALNRGAPPGRIRPGNLRLWQSLDGDRSPEPDKSGWGHVGFVTGTTKILSPSYETFMRPAQRLFAAAAAAAAVNTAVGQTISAYDDLDGIGRWVRTLPHRRTYWTGSRAGRALRGLRADLCRSRRSRPRVCPRLMGRCRRG
jgi:hypothetical protein